MNADVSLSLNVQVNARLEGNREVVVVDLDADKFITAIQTAIYTAIQTAIQTAIFVDINF